jgi:hypothetical protein
MIRYLRPLVLRAGLAGRAARQKRRLDQGSFFMTVGIRLKVR